MAYVINSHSRDPHRWVVFGVISSVYFLVFFHRVSTSVIAPDLLATFNTNATALGFMSSMYFYFYALEQPLVGQLTDALGPRKVVGFWSLAATLGCVLFGLAPTIGWATIGRGLIGFGVGGVYVPAMKSFAQWFREKEFATMTGFFLAAGNLGAIVATTPLAWMSNVWGWRSSFLIIGGMTLMLALATLVFVRDHDTVIEPLSKEVPIQNSLSVTSWESVLRVLSSLRFWVLAALFFGFFGPYFTFQGLWATPFIMSMLNLDALRASGLNMLIPVGFILGAPLSGWLADRILHSKVDILLWLLALMTAIWAILALGFHFIATGGMIVLLLAMGGIAGGFTTNLWALVRETTSSPILGLTSGLLNPFPLLGPAILQGWTGAIVNRMDRVNGIYPTTAFKNAFTVCLMFIISCLILCAAFRKLLPKKD
ncbi:MAG: MFS transporter [Deltaproteobacteria bacterium]|nr:MFS transporter [Deltaproteobacteria bacterium]MBW2334533.1 MFS transporter [Deltaproteobacteria bacterium]